MSVEVEVCSSALIKLGAEPINDLTDDTKEARLCRSQFPKVRDSVLRSAPWGFAVRRALLAPVVETLPWDSDEKVFQLPADCVRAWKINDGHPQYKFRIEGRRLITAADEVKLFYVTNDAPVSDWSADFKESLACMLAADLAYSITQSAALKQGLEQTAEFWISQARSTNSQEQTPEDFDFDDFLRARRGGHEIYP